MPVMLIRHGETFPQPTQHENIEATIVKALSVWRRARINP